MSAYCETCAAIGHVYVNYRLFLLHGESKYYDVLAVSYTHLAFSKCESEGRYKNFERAAHPSDTYDVGKLMPYSFDDTDPYKTDVYKRQRLPWAA